MEGTRTLRPLFRALPLAFVAGCAASRAASEAAPELLFAHVHELRGGVSTASTASTESLSATTATTVAAPVATPWISGLFGIAGAEPLEPRRALLPWSEDPWMDVEPPVYTRHLTLSFGQRTVTDDDAQDLDIDNERVYGLDYDSFEVPSGHGWECGVNFAGSDGSFMGMDGEFRTRELYVGYRRTFLTQVRGVQPYLSLGLTHMYARVELGPMNSDDAAWGAYGRLGINWELSDRVRLGIDYRRVYGTQIDAFGLGVDSDHDQLAVTLGYGF